MSIPPKDSFYQYQDPDIDTDDLSTMPTRASRHRPVETGTDDLLTTTLRASRSALRRPTTNTDDVISLTPRASHPKKRSTALSVPVPSTVRTTEPVKSARSFASFMPHSRPVLIGTGMILTLLLLILGQSVFNWGTTALDDLHYGRPRTFQTDAFVGHETSNQPSHFLALNLKGRVEIIEIPGADNSHVRVLSGPLIYSPNADLVPITLQFSDPHHTHHPDMIVIFQSMRIVYRNVHTANGWAFIAPD